MGQEEPGASLFVGTCGTLGVGETCSTADGKRSTMEGPMDSTLQSLRHISLLASLSDEALLRVARVAERREFVPGEIVILAGEPCRAAYLVSSGQVRVYRLSTEGREQVLARLGPGQAFNTVPVFHDQGVNHATVEAVAPTVLYAIRREHLRRLLLDCPDLAWSLLQDMAQRLDHLTNLVEDLSLRTVRGRLARFLLDHAHPTQVTGSWTQEEIAASLGTVRDMVGRSLRALADAGLLRMERQRITLLDRSGLEAEAES